jgi:hypothetical protein
MKKILLGGAALLALSIPATATVITVTDLGTVFNDSISFPSTHTPGAGQAFDFYFEFNTPVAETLSASMSDSATTGSERITGGVLSLFTLVSTSPIAPFVPSGTLIDSSPIVNFPGGQVSTAGPAIEPAGEYFAEIKGVSGISTLKLAIDGNVTAIPQIPEASTWSMMLLGFCGLAYAGSLARRRDSVSLIG